MTDFVVIVGLVIVGASAASGGVWSHRRWVTWARAQRVRLVLVPEPEWTVSADAFDALVASVAQARAWYLPARLQTFRVEWVAAGGHLVTVLELPERMARAARYALPKGLQLVDLDFAARFEAARHPAVEGGPSLTRDSSRCEFVVVSSKGRRLPVLPPEIDLADGMAELARRCADDESVTLMVDIAPLSRRAVREWRQEVVDKSGPASTRSLRGGTPKRARARSGGDLGQVIDDLSDMALGGAGVGASSEVRQGDVVLHRAAADHVKRALGASRPVRVQMLAVAHANGRRDRAGSLLAQLHSTIAPMGSPGDAEILKRTGRRHFARRLRSEDGPFLRHGFDRRARTGAMRADGAIVTLAELLPLLRPATKHAHSDAILRPVVVPAPKLPLYRRKPGVLPIGTTLDHNGHARVVGMPTSQFLFGLSAGRAGYGKTNQGIVQALHLALVERHGLFFLDPQRDAIRDMLPYLHAERERLAVVDLTRDDHREHHVAWNPLAMHGMTAGDLTARTEDMTAAIALAARWSSNAPRSITYARQLMRTMLYLSLSLPPECSPTLLTAHEFITNEELRSKLVKVLPDQLARWWREAFGNAGAAAVGPLDNTLAGLLGSDGARAVLGSPVSTYSGRKAVRDGMIILASAGDSEVNNLGGLLLGDVLSGVRASGEIADKQRRRLMWLLLDEAQMYDDGEQIPAIFQTLRKFGGRSLVFTQSPAKLHARTLDAIATNASYLSTTAQSAEGAGWFEKQWGLDLGGLSRSLQQWERFRYLAQPTQDGRRTKPFTVEGLSIEAAWGDRRATDEQLAELQADMRKKFMPQTVGETLKEAEGHSALVLSAALGEGRRNAPSESEIPRDFFGDASGGISFG